MCFFLVNISGIFIPFFNTLFHVSILINMEDPAIIIQGNIPILNNNAMSV